MSLSSMVMSWRGSPAFFVVVIAVLVFYIAAEWRLFTKAGRPGWAVLIPVYNLYVQIKIAGKPGWWLILYLIPFVNIIIALFVAFGLARAFSKSVAFGVGLWLLGFIFYPILGFGDAHYGRRSDGPLVAAYAAQAQYAQGQYAQEHYEQPAAAPAVGAAWVAPSTPPPWSTRPVAPPPPPGA